MKRILITSVLLILMICICNTCLAQTIDSKEFGLTFTLSDDWIKVDERSDSILFHHAQNNGEGILVEIIDADWAYDMAQVDEISLQTICDDMYSDTRLANDLSLDNNANVNIKTESVISNFEYYNGVEFYRYEKAYTASAEGYLNTSFYKTVFVTAKNGKIYFISYQRNYKENHFSDLVALLNSLSFENGVIKIYIDGERIYPDSAPMIIDGRTLVPIRAIAEKMDYDVEWNEETREVSLNSKTASIVFKIGSEEVFKNQIEKITLDVSAVIIRSRAYLPLRAAIEAMDAKVEWNQEERKIEIVR